MTDSTETGASCVAACERGLLIKDLEFWIEQSDIWKRLANDERDVTNRLRAVIEDAPHEAGCMHAKFIAAGWKPQGRCTCWKADAL